MVTTGSIARKMVPLGHGSYLGSVPSIRHCRFKFLPRNQPAQKATGLGAVAGGLSEVYVPLGLALTFVFLLVVIVLGKSLSGAHPMRGLFFSGLDRLGGSCARFVRVNNVVVAVCTLASELSAHRNEEPCRPAGTVLLPQTGARRVNTPMKSASLQLVPLSSSTE